MVRIFKIYFLSSLQIYSTAAVTAVTLLSITSAGLTSLIPARLCLVITFL